MADFGIGETLAALAASGSGAGIGAGAGAIFEAAGTASTLSTIGTVASIGSSLIGGLGALTSGSASKAAANYNSQVAAENAALTTQQANWASQAGEQQVGEATAKTRATVGAIKAAEAANNVDVNSGSAVDVRSSASALGELSALNIRSNATRQAYGFETQAASDKAQSQLDEFSGQQSQLAGEVGAGSTILGGAGSAALNYSRFLSSNSPLNTTV